MPATSEAQRRLFGMVHAAQKGTLKDPSVKIKAMAASIDPKVVVDFTRKEAGSGWVGVPITGDLKKKILRLGQQVDAADLHPKGRETAPHVTVLYGLHTQTADPVKAALRQHKKLKFTLGDVTAFKHEDKDVLKLDVHPDPSLLAAHRQLAALPNSNEYLEYKPHVTLAYLQPGTAAKYMEKITPIRGEVTSPVIEFSTEKGIRERIPLGAVEKVSSLVLDEAQMNTYGVPRTLGDSGGHMSVNTAAHMILQDPYMSVSQQAVAFDILAKASQGRPAGVFTRDNLIEGALGAGFGYIAARTLGSLLGTVFGADRVTQRRLAQAGAIAGALNAVL